MILAAVPVDGSHFSKFYFLQEVIPKKNKIRIMRFAHDEKSIFVYVAQFVCPSCASAAVVVLFNMTKNLFFVYVAQFVCPSCASAAVVVLFNML